MRIALAGIVHESLTFSPVPTRLPDFRVFRGPEVLERYNVDQYCAQLGLEPVPILYATHIAPGGTVELEAYQALRDELVERLVAAGPVDGICLALHGAMLVREIWSGETDLVRTIRAAVGRTVPIAVRLDMHANLTEEFANKVDTWCSFRTAPHRDVNETLLRTLTVLKRIIAERLQPRPVFVRIPTLFQGEKATTAIDPMRSFVAQVEALEQEPGILNAEVFVGFGWADAPHSGSNVVVTATGPEHLPAARRAAHALAQQWWDRRHEFTFDQEVAPSADEAIAMALAAPESTVFLTDSGDNITAGAPGDSSHVLSRLLARQVPDAVVAPFWDAEACAACFTAGLGGQVSVTVGGKLDRASGPPVPVTGVVEHLWEPPPGLLDARLATLRVGGVRIVLTSIRKYFKDPDDFRRAGIDPLAHKLVVIKLGYLLAGLRAIAPREILAVTPGCSDMELTRLPYRYVCRPIFPLETDFEWRAEES